ncbi:Dynein light chain 1, cytoplasmic [Coemansia guatemalensis]|uniref:Dynein light chain n=2 Tax=Coemansia TaxID=4863 RepID=A0A9W8LUC1_9FUNG|nr:Dynein light chain 1, cytoplasmic [Coemansia guatemalensis]PIA16941.1 structural analysis of A cytoplasmic dynein light chain intermediate chain complex [Coemansia reversa NRRL 1564]|eukprot:PIA16941.1 structural analysis of A cytoplasmic dynein light chain intermediate chain complex [Coemansia reversa NRRL 1564]
MDANSGQPSVKSADMSDAMQTAIIEFATAAHEQHNLEKDIARYIKVECDKKYGKTWHVIVGRNFGSFVTHEVGHFVYFYNKHLAHLVFKSG